MSWFVAALSTAILWGFVYCLGGEIVKQIDKKTYIFLSSLTSTIVYGCLCWDKVPETIQALQSKKIVILWLVLAIISTLTANYLSLLAVQLKNASLASMVEISYPLWVVLFTYLIFSDKQVSILSVIGGIFVIIGIMLVAGSEI